MILTAQRRRRWLAARYEHDEPEAIARAIASGLSDAEISGRIRPDEAAGLPSERREQFVRQQTLRFRERPGEGLAVLAFAALDRIAAEAALETDLWEEDGLTADDLRRCAAFVTGGMEAREPGSDPDARARRWAARPHELREWIEEEAFDRGTTADALLAAVRGGARFHDRIGKGDAA